MAEAPPGTLEVTTVVVVVPALVVLVVVVVVPALVVLVVLVVVILLVLVVLVLVLLVLVVLALVEVVVTGAAPGRHWEYQSFWYTQELPEVQQVAPDQPMPPHWTLYGRVSRALVTGPEGHV